MRSLWQTKTDETDSWSLQNFLSDLVTVADKGASHIYFVFNTEY